MKRERVALDPIKGTNHYYLAFEEVERESTDKNQMLVPS